MGGRSSLPGLIIFCNFAQSCSFSTYKICHNTTRGEGSMGAMGAWAPINISSGVTNGFSTLYYILLKRSRYSNRGVNNSNKAVTLETFFFSFTTGHP